MTDYSTDTPSLDLPVSLLSYRLPCARTTPEWGFEAYHESLLLAVLLRPPTHEVANLMDRPHSLELVGPRTSVLSPDKDSERAGRAICTWPRSEMTRQLALQALGIRFPGHHAKQSAVQRSSHQISRACTSPCSPRTEKTWSECTLLVTFFGTLVGPPE